MFGLNPWVLLFVGAGLLVSHGLVAIKATQIANTACRAAELQAEVDDLNRQLSVWKLAAEAAEEANKELEAENADADKLLDEIRANAGACKFTVEQRCRMLKLAGGVCKQAAPPP